MGRKAAPLDKGGKVTEIDGIYRAHVQYSSETGRNLNLYGPRRMLASEAAGDLESMRAAAAVFPNDRVQAFQSMHAEARRIQLRVKYERDIEMARLRRMASIETDSENDETGDLLVEDTDEWWRDLQDGKITTEDVGVKKEVKPRGPINSPIEATDHLMNTFRPIDESVKELRRLLEGNADPNAPIPEGRLSPLRHVILFAPEETVAEMRDLLLQRGAKQSKDDLERWAIRQASDACEYARTNAFYEDDRHLSPCGAAMNS